MRLPTGEWLAALVDIGRAFIDVLKAEWQALTADFGASGRLLARGLLILAVALVLIVWVVILLSLALAAYLETFVERWQAILIVAGGMLVIGVLLLLWGKSVVGRVRKPSEMVQTRLADHRAWLDSQIGRVETRGEESEDAVEDAVDGA